MFRFQMSMLTTQPTFVRSDDIGSTSSLTWRAFRWDPLNFLLRTPTSWRPLVRELELLQRGGGIPTTVVVDAPVLDEEDVEDLEEAPEDEVEAAEEQILDQATAARTIAELKAEIETLKQLEGLALAVRRSGTDRKWRELANLLSEIFTPVAIAREASEESKASVTAVGNQLKASASRKTGDLHGTSRHAELSGTAHLDALGTEGRCSLHSRRHGPGRTAEDAGGIPARP
jgi:hypothetical protein